ncbi:hypothetical protein [Microlunatus sagamiharensis]|uniref:hypothetical protein n=1 Tax=Microlunatus sagamiharensis TaxID=546874 RepID=UPI0012FE329A|nr:hypothetical protein [Microlunatus sagamiharensis]
MGELRAYVVPVATLRYLLTGTERRERVLGLVRRVLPPASAPAPLGPLFARVPGTRPVPHDEPTPADLDRLLGGEPVPAGRLPATWRLVEAVAAGLATAAARVPSARPTDLRPLGLPLPVTDAVTAGTWTSARTSDVPGLAAIAEQAVPDGLVVFWTADEGRGPTG